MKNSEDRVTKAVSWFKEIGYGKNWLLGKNQSGLTDELKDYLDGESFEFLIWHCLGFDWFQHPGGDYPLCRITDGLEVAITSYFYPRILEVGKKLSRLGQPPRFTVMIPSNEGLYEKMWKYTQSRNERELILDRAVDGLNQKFQGLDWPNGSAVEAIRWDRYLRRCGVKAGTEYYSERGRQIILSSEKYLEIRAEAIRNGVDHFASRGIRVNPRLIVNKRIMYYGVYAGEGCALDSLRRKGRKIIVLNFEEMRVSRMTLLGSEAGVAIITPIKPREMEEYYRWRKKEKLKHK